MSMKVVFVLALTAATGIASAAYRISVGSGGDRAEARLQSETKEWGPLKATASRGDGVEETVRAGAAAHGESGLRQSMR